MSIRLCKPATVKKISCLVAGIVSFNTVESWNTKFLNSEFFLLTLMFTIWLIIYASASAFNLLARAFNLSTRALNFATCAFSLLTRGFNLLTCAFNLPTRVFKLATHASSLLTRGFELITRRFELVTPEFEFVTHGFELLTRGFEFLTDNLCYTFPKHWHFKFIQRWVFHQQYFIAVSGILSFTTLRDLIYQGHFYIVQCLFQRTLQDWKYQAVLKKKRWPYQSQAQPQHEFVYHMWYVDCPRCFASL